MLGRSYRLINDKKVTVMVIQCLDPKFTSGIEEFIKEELGLEKGEFVQIKVAGGPASLLYSEGEEPSKYSFFKKQIMVSLTRFPLIKKIVLIAHKHCGYYTTLPKSDYYDTEREKNDLPKAAKLLGTIITQEVMEKKIIEISLYYAGLISGQQDEIFFEHVS